LADMAAVLVDIAVLVDMAAVPAALAVMAVLVVEDMVAEAAMDMAAVVAAEDGEAKMESSFGVILQFYTSCTHPLHRNL